MNVLLIYINKFLNKKLLNLNEFPQRVLNKISYHLQFPRNGFSRYHTDNFIKEISRKYDVKGNLLLDVGAGHQPYKKYFKHAKYESCDNEQVIKEMQYDTLETRHDFYCDINIMIPKADNTYDFVICSEVLEHVYNPLNTISEISRILKKNGKLFISVPQCGGEHMLPHNYFNYLEPGLKYLLEKNNLKCELVEKKSGIYHLLGTLLNKIANQIFNKKNTLVRILLLPLEIFVRLILFLLNFFLFFIDKIDKKQSWSLQYFVIAVKI